VHYLHVSVLAVMTLYPLIGAAPWRIADTSYVEFDIFRQYALTYLLTSKCTLCFIFYVIFSTIRCDLSAFMQTHVLSSSACAIVHVCICGSAYVCVFVCICMHVQCL